LCLLDASVVSSYIPAQFAFTGTETLPQDVVLNVIVGCDLALFDTEIVNVAEIVPLPVNV